MLDKIKTTAKYIQERTNFLPQVGIILGSGLGGLVSEIKIEHELNYSEIPNFPVSTVKGHGSKMIFGTLNGTNVIALQGRFHFYEGYTMQEVVFPVRVLKFLGIKLLILSNASGGVNPEYKVGDLMILDDHINMMNTNPLIGKNEEELGPRFPDMGEPYDKNLIAKAKSIADKNNFTCHIGVYASVTGPTFETRAEYKYIRTIGADCVGMSTVPENIVARHMGLPVFAISIITDVGGGDHLEKITHDEVLKVANLSEQKMTVILKELIGK
jgi:purine-nucleoside phosphorylase